LEVTMPFCKAIEHFTRPRGERADRGGHDGRWYGRGRVLADRTRGYRVDVGADVRLSHGWEGISPELARAGTKSVP